MIEVIDGGSIGGIGFTDPSPDVVYTLSCVEKDFNLVTAPDMMFCSLGGVIIKIDYAVEYVGDEFTVTNGADTWTGNFKENENYSNPTKLIKV